jgi:hypothetical protein
VTDEENCALLSIPSVDDATLAPMFKFLNHFSPKFTFIFAATPRFGTPAALISGQKRQY